MFDSACQGAAVKVVIDPYSRRKVQDLLQLARRDFGSNRNRWQWKSDPDFNAKVEGGAWGMIFVFQDPHDAVMFSLKYS
jgi:hypothetical protein